MIKYRGVKFSGYNKPKRTKGHKTKSHAVLAKVGKKVKLIRFGQQGVSGAGKIQKLKLVRLGADHLRLGMLKIFVKERCLLLIGQIKLNGKS